MSNIALGPLHLIEIIKQRNRAMKKIYLILFLFLSVLAPTSAQLIINEVLYDPSNVGLEGDANGDSIYSQTADEFIEFVNIGTLPLDVSGYQILDDSALNTVVYTIPSGIIIPPNGALVVFGGGTPRGLFGGAIVLADTGDGLNLNNSGEIIIVRNALGNNILRFDSDALSNNPNESYTRNPDITGLFVQHASVNIRKFSPGTKVNGEPFIQSVQKQITVKVDLSEFGASFDSVFVSGNFNNYCNNCLPLSDNNGDKVFEGNIASTLDTFIYYFVIKSNLGYQSESFAMSAPCVIPSNSGLSRWLLLTKDTVLNPVCFSSCNLCKAGLTLKGVMDFITPALGSSGKGIHLQASANIANLNIYGIGVANNGGGSDGQEYRFPSVSIPAGAQILLARDSVSLKAYLAGCSQTFTHYFIDTIGIVNQNGDDAIELYRAGAIIETYGNSDEDGTGKVWEYTGAWAYKLTNGQWLTGAINCTDSTETIYDTDCIYPVCSDIKVAQINVNSAQNTITQPGGTLQMTVEVLPMNAPNKTVTWSADSPALASISANGLLTAIANGKVIVKATANDGSGVFGSKEITISGQSSSVAELNRFGLNVFPNPVTHTLYIHASQAPEAYTLFDVFGKVVANGTLSVPEISMETLVPGIYFLDLSIGDSHQRIRIIKN